MVTKDKLELKLIDFASCYDLKGTEFERMLEKEKQEQKNSRKKQEYKYFVGTPHYMPVESVRNKGVSKATDIWSLGCILYQLIVGFPPFLGGSEYLIFQKSIEAKYIFPEGIVDSARDLIEKTLKLNSEERLTIDEILQHEFLNDTPKKYPVYHLREIAYEKVKDNFVKKYQKDAKISLRIKEIDENIHLNKDRLNESNEGKDKIEEEINNAEKELADLKEKLDILKNCFDEEFNKTVESLTKCDYLIEGTLQKISAKFRHLRKQIYHDLFNILFDYDL